jgi:hypothetical protein
MGRHDLEAVGSLPIGDKSVYLMRWPQAAECNMITTITTTCG